MHYPKMPSLNALFQMPGLPCPADDEKPSFPLAKMPEILPNNFALPKIQDLHAEIACLTCPAEICHG